MQILNDLQAIRKARAIIKAIKKGDVDAIDKLLDNAPEEIKEKIKRMAEVYHEAIEGKIPRDQAARAIANEVGLSGSPGEFKELLELIADLLE